MPKVLSEAQLHRLATLDARKQTGERLNAEERLELRRLQAEQKAAAAAAALARIANAETRRIDQRRNALGKLAMEAGLGKFSDSELQWGFGRLAEALNRADNESANDIVTAAPPRPSGEAPSSQIAKGWE